VTISLLETNQKFRVRQNSDQVQIYHDGTDAYIHTTDGQIILNTDEAAAAAAIGLTDSDGSHELYFDAPALAADVTYTFPATVDNGKYLKCDANGDLSWDTPSGGAANATDITDGVRITGIDDAIIELYDGALSAKIQLSDAEGITNEVDVRLGLPDANQKFILCDLADIEMDFTHVSVSQPTLEIRNAAGNAYVYLESSAMRASGAFAVHHGGGLTFQQRADLSAGNSVTFDQQGATYELTDTNGHQAGVFIGYEIAQTDTAAWSAIHVNPTITSEGDGSTSATGENALIDFEADSAPVWNVCVEKVVFAHTGTLFDASATTDTQAVFTIPANSRLLSCVMVLNTQFAGVTTLSVELGINAGDADGILAPGLMDLTSDAANSNYSQHGALWDTAASNGGMYYFDGATQLDAKATSTVEDLDQTSAGAVTFYFTYMTLVSTT